MFSRIVFSTALIGFLVAAGLRSGPAVAIPIFAHQYGVTCEKCHSVIPHLNAFGAAFMASGYRIPGVKPGPAFPIAAKMNLVASTENQGDGLPKDIVDEVETFTAGAIGDRASYFLEQYVVDGGMPGLTRDAWIIDRVNPWNSRIPVFAQAGSFTLPVPVDPETFRDSYQGYAVMEQTVGNNPFNFFDPKIGIHASAGDATRGLSGQAFVGQGHDRQSGTPSYGDDWMGVLQEAMGPFSFSGYRYSGARPLASGVIDRFARNGFALVYNDFARWEWDNLIQTGWDSNCNLLLHAGCASSGGLTQLRYMFSRRLFAEGRYEGTNSPASMPAPGSPSGGFYRDGLVMLGYGTGENSRVTLENVISNSAPAHVWNLQFTIGI
ncbi:MAG TPA: hypothetical protein VKT72_06845 [Candidatus Baltobacteraceae bacterium]|nr:hypothetical protein [Candidatus Baltobacteraceae bacterium]